MVNTTQFKLKDKKPDLDFIKWNESMSHKQDIDFYYEGSHPFIRYVEKLRLRKITYLTKSHIKKNNISNPTILEVGCGTGHVLEEIARSVETGELIGLDPLQWWLEKAKNKLEDKVKLIQGFAEDLPFENNSMDIVICTEVIEHVINPTVVLRELKRVLKKEGLIIVSTPNEKLINELKDIVDSLGFYKLFFSNIPRRNDDEWHLHSFDLKSFKACIPPEIKVKSVIPVPFAFLPLRYVMAMS